MSVVGFVFMSLNLNLRSVCVLVRKLMAHGVTVADKTPCPVLPWRSRYNHCSVCVCQITALEMTLKEVTGSAGAFKPPHVPFASYCFQLSVSVRCLSCAVDL
ncbi:hypothetical protein XELAEV_18019853mg [Xenopus laevis]|uniref:Secreted protein n=1 Tax=Xenopus laevis TaxID=8355 RepID=A0A974D6Q2_XENLA|nr:hypothetical protein XELAEV_18019853mg [Xenopus laevis]